MNDWMKTCSAISWLYLCVCFFFFVLSGGVPRYCSPKLSSSWSSAAWSTKDSCCSVCPNYVKKQFWKIGQDYQEAFCGSPKSKVYELYALRAATESKFCFSFSCILFNLTTIRANWFTTDICIPDPIQVVAWFTSGTSLVRGRIPQLN